MPTAKRIANKNLAAARKPIASKGRLVRTDAARFEAWLKDFDARMEELTSRQDTLMRKLGVAPVRTALRERD